MWTYSPTNEENRSFLKVFLETKEDCLRIIVAMATVVCITALLLLYLYDVGFIALVRSASSYYFIFYVVFSSVCSGWLCMQAYIFITQILAFVLSHASELYRSISWKENVIEQTINRQSTKEVCFDYSENRTENVGFPMLRRTWLWKGPWNLEDTSVDWVNNIRYLQLQSNKSWIFGCLEGLTRCTRYLHQTIVFSW